MKEKDFLAWKKAARAEYVRREAEKLADRDAREKYDRENQPRDEEEARNALAEDAKLAENLRGILGVVADMDDREFADWERRNRRAIRKAGGKSRVRTGRTQARKKGCAVVGIALVGAASTLLWGAVEIVGQVIS